MANNQYNETDASNQESIAHMKSVDRKRGVDKQRREGVMSAKPSYADGKKLRIVHSNSPAIAAKIKPKKTTKPLYKRD